MQWHLGGPRITELNAGAGDTEPTNFDDISHANDEQDDPQLEALNDVGAGELEEVLLFDALEDAAFNFDKLVRHEQREQGVGVGVDGHVQRDDLVEEGDSVHTVVEKGKAEHAER